MSIETINVGSSPNDGSGDSLRTSFIICNNNFSYLGGGFSNVNNGFGSNAAAAYSLSFSLETDQKLSKELNTTTTVSYANVTAGADKLLVFKNRSGASRTVVLPNNNNNKGTTSIVVANSTTAFFNFTSFGTDAANVAVLIANV